MRTVGAAAMIFASLLAPSGSKALPVQGVVGTLIPTSTMDHVYTFNIVNGAGTVVFDATRYTVECFRISAGIFNFAVGNARNGSRNLYFHVRTVDLFGVPPLPRSDATITTTPIAGTTCNAPNTAQWVAYWSTLVVTPQPI